MPRSRNIKPGFFDNAELGKLDSDIRLLFAALWQLADREGVLEYDAAYIRRYVFGYRPEVTELDIHRYITVISRLSNGDTLVLKKCHTKTYIVIVNFLRHQAPHNTEKKGKLPLLKDIMSQGVTEDNGYVTVTSPLDNGRNPPDSCFLIPDSLIPDSISREQPEKIKPPNDDFENFWNVYGKIGSRQQALKSYKKIKGVSHEDIIAGVIKYQDYCRSIGQEQRYIKHASTWLNNRGWEDEYIVYKTAPKSKHQRAKEALGLA